MQWIHNFDLFLFDCDGLLVNTEEIHYMAYKRMCAARGVNLNWSFEYYCTLAHYSSDGLKNEIYIQFPQLVAQVSGWEILYNEKRQAVLDLLNEGAVHTMPGVEQLLTALDKAAIPRCVVTHSPDELVSIVRSKNPILDAIPHWITRHHYTHPKPNSECYLKAIELFAKPSARVIGFEDTPRGMNALMGTRAKSVMICTIAYPEIASFVAKGALHFPFISDIPVNLQTAQ